MSEAVHGTRRHKASDAVKRGHQLAGSLHHSQWHTSAAAAATAGPPVGAAAVATA